MTEDGRGIGCGKTVYIEGRPADEVAVHVSLYWTSRDGIRGRLDEEVVVPWMGSTRRELDGGAWMATEINPVATSAEDADTSDPAGS